MRSRPRSRLGQIALQAEIGHDGGNDAAAAQPAALVPLGGDERHQLVAIDQIAALIDEDQPVGIAVERDADVGPELPHLVLQLVGGGRAAIVVDVEAVRLDADGDDLGAELPQGVGGDAIGGTVGAIDHHPQARKGELLGEGVLGELDIAGLGILDSLGAAHLVGPGERHALAGFDQRLDGRLVRVGKLEPVRAEDLDAIVVEGIVRGRDHDAEVGPERACQHGHGRGGQRTEQEHVHAGRQEPGGKRLLDHVTRQTRVLAHHHAVAVAAAAVFGAGGGSDLEHRRGIHGPAVGPAPNPIRAEIAAAHLPWPLLALARRPE